MDSVQESEEAKLREENRDVLVDLDIKEYRRAEMKMLGKEGSDLYVKIQKEIETLRARKPAIDRKLAELRKKQDHIAERETRY
jgi:UDP:flavonoid glycosyltransferase YjiC (YdhE family)